MIGFIKNVIRKVGCTMVSRKNYSSWSDYLKNFDVGQYIDFAQHLIDKYRDKLHGAALFDKQLAVIQEKQNDTKLNISVIGEFSTGKSTFINALLRCNLLEECSLQGTTQAVTVLEYAPDYLTAVKYSKPVPPFPYNIPNPPHKYDSFEQFKKAVAEYAATADAKDIETVSATLPAEILNSGVRILDTPGTNSEQAWHSEATIRALHDISDLSVIVVDATKPMPATFIDFIKEHLSDILNRCVFLLTKYDRIEEKDRKRLFQFMNAKLKASFGLENAELLPFSSSEILKAFVDNTSSRDSEIVKLSLESEKSLITFAAKQRGAAQAQKLLSLIGNVYSELSESMSTLSNDFTQELELLNKSKNADLSSFIAEQKKERCDAFEAKARSSCERIKSDIRDKKERCIKGVRVDLWRKDSVRQIKNYVNDGELRRRCRMEAHDMTDRLDEATGTVKECFMQELRNFQSEFQKKFRGLSLLDVSFAPKSIDTVAPSSISPVDLDSASRNISSTLDEGVISAGLGAAGGAALGFALGGPVGGLLGGLFGAAAGSACDMDAVKKDVWREMSSDVSRFFSDVIDECSSSLDSYVYNSKNRLSREIDNYYSEYRQCVDNRIAQWNSKKASVEQQIADINADVVALDNNRSAINSIVARMKAE